MLNFILDTDSYKLSHFLGYPSDAEHIYSYAEARGGRYNQIVMFGLQRYLKYLADVRITHENVDEAVDFAKGHLVPFNEAGFRLIVDEYEGKIPVRISALPEGTVVPVRTPLVTVENTDPRMPWLTSYLETPLLSATWYPVTVATRVHGMKRKIKPYFDDTSDTGFMDLSFVDFSRRGVTSQESAKIAGLAHLLSFATSDNIPAIMNARKYYDCEMAAISVPATEHSVTTSWGRDGEAASLEYMIDNMMPEGGILSVVADTWNVFEFTKLAATMAERIRNKKGTLVIRPDSGDMRQVLSQVLPIALNGFGARMNVKGYQVLRDVKILQGDGINEDTVTVPFKIAKGLGISADSIVVGSGGGLAQADIDRDTCKFAYKASNVRRGGVDIPIAKDPVTDPGKRSKQGKFAVVNIDGNITTLPEELVKPEVNMLRPVYNNGELLNVESLDTIRARLAKSL